MRVEVPYFDYDLKVSQKDKYLIEKMVDKGLREFKGNKAELEKLMLECITNLSNSASMASQLSQQNILQRLFGNITGKNELMLNALYKGTANTQYAQQQILVKLIEQNSNIMDLVASIHKGNHTIILDIKQNQLDTNEHLKKVVCNLIENRNAILSLNEKNEHLSKELNNVLFACPSCRAFVLRKDQLCSKCGHVLKKDCSSLSTLEGVSHFENDLVALSGVIKEVQDMNKIVSKSKIDWYQEKIRKIRRFIDKAQIPSEIRENVLNCCEGFECFLDKQHIEIAIVGTVKAGKSSLINALLDMEFATVDTTPETSVLAKYRTTNGENYLKVRFYSESDWKSVWKQAEKSPLYKKEYDELGADKERSKWIGHEEYFKSNIEIIQLQSELTSFTSSKSPIHFFVQEVEVGIHSNLFPNDVYLVDTPGLDDAVDIRSNVTREYLDKADAVLACIKEKDIHEASEAEFISKVLSNRSAWNTVYVLATQKDLDKPTDVEKNSKYFIENNLEPMLNPSNSNASHTHKKYTAAKQFFAISAKVYNYSLAYDKDELSDEDFDDYVGTIRKMGFRNEAEIPNQLEDIKNQSGIPHLKFRLEKNLFVNTRKLLYRNTDVKYDDFLKQLHAIVSEKSDACHDRINLLVADESELSKYRRELEIAQSYASQLQDFIDKLKAALKGGA